MKAMAAAVIRQPVEKVFSYVEDLSNDANWRGATGITESGWRSEGPPGPGEVGYSRIGNEMEVEWRVVSYHPGESVRWEYLSGPLRGHAGYLLVSVDGGTEFTLLVEAEFAGWYRLLGPLIAWMVRRQMRADVEKLREILEAE